MIVIVDDNFAVRMPSKLPSVCVMIIWTKAFVMTFKTKSNHMIGRKCTMMLSRIPYYNLSQARKYSFVTKFNIALFHLFLYNICAKNCNLLAETFSQRMSFRQLFKRYASLINIPHTLVKREIGHYLQNAK